MKSMINFAAKAAGVGTLATLMMAAAGVEQASAFSFEAEPYNPSDTVLTNCSPPGSFGCRSRVAGATTQTFNSNAALNGTPYQALIGTGLLKTGSVTNKWAAPLDDDTRYLVIGNSVPSTANGPLPSSPINTITFDFSSLGAPLDYYGMYWGSIDAENKIEFLSGGSIVATVLGSDINSAANGSTTDPLTNQYVHFFAHGTTFDSVRLSYNGIAFETDNHAYRAVPEPTTMAGLAVAGGVGVFLKRRQKRQAAQG